MRLICPNCGAQYEVDDQVIPDDGRDVQCSNCGHSWFQRPAHLDRDLADELALDLADPDAADTEAKPDAETEAETTAEHGRRRGLDPDVADVLREEADREAMARRADRSGLESQPDLGLDDSGASAASRSAAARARMARMRGLDEASPADAAASAASRRDLLPDIEEINSTLRASQDRDATDAAAPAPSAELIEDTGPDRRRRRRGFRLGFGLSVLAVAGAVLLYAMAPRIAGALPQAEPYLIRYVDWANTTRHAVDDGMTRAVARLNNMIGGSGGQN